MQDPRITDSLFLRATKPSRYMGGEVNSVRKIWDSGKTSFALVFPEPYEIGMSHLGFQIIYHLLNSDPHVVCERVFLPWSDMQELMIREKIELFSLESRRPLKDFDIVGFSLPYEMGFTNILSIFKLAGIDPLSSERDERSPLFIAGGPAIFNPEPVSPFFDAMVIGEAEEAVMELVNEFKRHKETGSGTRKELLSRLAGIEGCYIPSFFEPVLDPDSGLQYLKPLEGVRPTVKRRIVKELKSGHLPGKPIVPFMQVTHDRVAVEIQRGCTKGCRFCQAGMIYRPTRQRNAQDILSYVKGTMAATGYEEVSFLSLNSSDHPSINAIFKRLSDDYADSGISLSLPSTRLDDFDEEVMKSILSLRKTGFTFAPEAGTERLRKAINKAIPDEEILKNLEVIFKAGWNLVKLYFMVGLPTETDDDIEGIIALTRKIEKIAKEASPKARINMNLSPYVPKPHTPYQWAPQDTLESLKEKIERIRNGLKSRRINIKWHDPELSAIEAFVSRGDRRVASVLLECHRTGGGLDAWSDRFSFARWQKAITASGGLGLETVNRPLPLGARLPWDHIDTGITKEFLLDELKKTDTLEPTPDCAWEECSSCGICDERIGPVTQEGRPDLAGFGSKPPRETLFFTMSIDFAKLGPSRLLSHLELIKLFERAFRRADISLKTSSGFHPIPLLRFGRALPIGVESESESLIVWVGKRHPLSEILRRLSMELPEGISINRISYPSKVELDLLSREGKVSYVVRPDTNKIKHGLIEERIAEFDKKGSFVVTKQTKKGLRDIDLKDIITKIEAKEGSLTVEFDESGPKINPLAAVSSILGVDLDFADGTEVRKIGQVKYGM